MKTEYNHGGGLGISNIWPWREEFCWANSSGEGTEPTFELAVQAAENSKIEEAEERMES